MKTIGVGAMPKNTDTAELEAVNVQLTEAQAEIQRLVEENDKLTAELEAVKKKAK